MTSASALKFDMLLIYAPGLPGTHQRHAVDEHVRQLLGVDLPQGGQVRVAAQQLEHVAHGLAVARQPDLAHARQPRLAHLRSQRGRRHIQLLTSDSGADMDLGSSLA